MLNTKKKKRICGFRKVDYIYKGIFQENIDRILSKESYKPEKMRTEKDAAIG